VRILLATEDLPDPRPGGLARHVLTLARLLADRGHDVDVAHKRDYGELAEPVPGRAIACLDLRHTGWREGPLGVFMYPRRAFIARRFATALHRIAPDYDVVHYHGHLPILANYLPDSVNFVQTIHDYGGVCPISVRLRRGAICTTTSPLDCVECVALRRGRSPNLARRWVTSSGAAAWRRAVRKALARSKTVFVSQHESQVFEQYLGSLEAARNWVIPNMANTHAIRAATVNVALGIPARVQPSLFMSGTVHQAKGFGLFLDIVCNDTRFDAWRISLAGNGPDLPMLKARFGNRVQWLGWLEHQDQLAEMANASAVVMPSIWEEPCPTIVLEGLALGKPVYALAIGSIGEPWVRAAGAGRLISGRSLQDLADRLVENQASPTPAMKEPDLEMVSHFSDQVVSKLEQVYAAKGTL
jgi:glycogen(starch) synthase